MRWSHRGNFPSIPTDCPQRDERLGWMADVGVFLPTAAYAMDLQGFMAKWIDDVLDAQSSEGAFPDLAPRGPHGPDGGPAWGDAGVIVPMTLYRRYGDRRLLERCFPAMRAWTDLVSRHNPDRIRSQNQLSTPIDTWIAGDCYEEIVEVALETGFDRTSSTKTTGMLRQRRSDRRHSVRDVAWTTGGITPSKGEFSGPEDLVESRGLD